MIRIKNRRAAKIQKAREGKEGGRRFSFQGRFEVSPIPCEYYSGTYETGLLKDGFGDIPGDDPPGPISAVITPTFVMCDGDSLPVLSSSLTVWGSEDDYWRNWPIFRLYFGEFSYEMASFNIAPGVPTGINRATLVGSPPAGEYNYDTRKFEMHLRACSPTTCATVLRRYSSLQASLAELGRSGTAMIGLTAQKLRSQPTSR